jgi:dihydroxyacetone kinase phosphoprotein-dependent L subunit
MAITELTLTQTKEMLIKVADAIVENKPLLTEVDSQTGDGDHGIGMSGGLSRAKDALLAGDSFENVNQLFKTTGTSMINSMGGASGVIFGTLFASCAKVESTETLTGPILAQMMSRSLADIKMAGRAQVGDKTMVDALEPAVNALNGEPQEDLISLLNAAQEAARHGMEDTKNYVAKLGRSRSLAERAIGFQDAGATSVWIIFRAMYEYVRLMD